MIYSLLLPWLLAVSVVTWTNGNEHDFGDLHLRQEVSHTFMLKNTSEEPFTIQNVRPSCGCTIPEWTLEPVLPDSTATIRVDFRPTQTGYLRKTIRVYVSTQKKAEKLFVAAYVEGK